jgi:glycosyltransferase involved in cell wall biosynthesis
MTTQPTNKLIVFTAGFPFGGSEPFLKEELKYLVRSFDTVMLVTVNPEGKITQNLHEACQLFSLQHKDTFFQKTRALFNLFDALFWEELQVLKNVYKKKISFSILATMLMGLQRAKLIKKFVLRTIKMEPNVNLYLYSYWCDDTAIGIALLQRSNPCLKTFSRLHGWDAYFEVNTINYLSYRHFITKNLNAIYSISSKGKAYCEHTWKINHPDKIKVSRLGVGVQKYLKLKEEHVIVTCSNLIPLKRIHLLVEALSLMKSFTLKWVHFGDGSERQRIQWMCETMLPASIEWELKGWIENTKVMEWYELYAPALFINLSTSEGVPVSIMEAMSFGIPAIATDVGGNNEIVNHLNGFLISSTPSAEEIADTLKIYFALSKVDQENMHQAAYETWKKDYNSEINYENFCKEILRL